MKNSNEKNQKPNLNVFSREYLSRSKLSYFLTSPFILMMIIPAVFADILASIFQAINFTIYEIPKVKRSEYVVVDRHHLKYLNFMEKFYCIYCGYVNGVIQYTAAIGARTEEFWCPIKHNREMKHEHSRYGNYLEYGDSESYHAKRKKIRLQMKKDLKDK
ncbi:hypothetical protein [Sulfuricurvum sp.]|uniref:hypothetical protein n=1 Tax=Sulfuricurvum sp. TaxID=2025608 RepID=UPI002607560B|nr:hypothetical protein [Sulfuricurvum sp.]MDD4948370.1 hypothetical protein [Sulfuricurvum sp.]